jgi:hypothetical protein
MPENHKGGAAPKTTRKPLRNLSEKEQLILEACSYFEELEIFTGNANEFILGSFIQQIGGTPKKITKARKILEDKLLFKDFCRLQIHRYTDEIAKKAQELQNADIAILKKRTAAIATATILILSPVVGKFENKALDWIGDEVSLLFGAAKKLVVPQPKQETPADNKFAENKGPAPEGSSTIINNTTTNNYYYRQPDRSRGSHKRGHQFQKRPTFSPK